MANPAVPPMARNIASANKRDVPYQTLLETWLAEKLEEVSKRE
ncbi:MAG: hypothetical protein QOH31_4560 [Verrucomicrobiota bacterium]